MKGPRRARAGYSLIELLVALLLSSVVFAAALSAILFLQKSYAATEQYSVNLADHARLLDQLSLDLRRATDATVQRDDNGATTGLTLRLPSYYSSHKDADDRDIYVPNTPKLKSGAAFYGPEDSILQVTYRLQPTFRDRRIGDLFNVITRQEGPETFREVAIAAAADGFPTVTFDAPTGLPAADFRDAIQCRLRVAFQPKFQTLGSAENNRIVLHNLTFLRNNDDRFR